LLKISAQEGHLVITGKLTLKGSQILMRIEQAAYGLFTAPGTYLSAEKRQTNEAGP
jgi:hypothetical protein